MNKADKFAIRLITGFVALAILTVLTAFASGMVKGNVKVEMTEERVVVSCVDGSDPVVRMVPRPRKGVYAVVICEARLPLKPQEDQ